MNTAVVIDNEKHIVNRLVLGFDWEKINYKVTASFTNGLEAVRMLPFLNPDVIITDIKMPGITGLELMDRVKGQCSRSRFVFISGFEEFSYVHQALKLGAAAYCLKPIDDEELEKILQDIQKDLQEEDINFGMLFDSVLSDHSEAQEDLFISKLEKVEYLNDKFIIAASIGDISEEINHYVRYHMFKYNTSTCFYFIENSPFIRSQGFQNRVKARIREHDITDFCYTHARLDKDISYKLKGLMSRVYSFFLGNDATDAFEFHDNVASGKRNSGFYRMLEELYGKRDMNLVLEHLKDYRNRYKIEERTVYDVIDIYNLVMTIIFQKENTLFTDRIERPYELAGSFRNIDGMMDYLIKQISGIISSDIGISIKSIRNDTFKNVILFINENYTNPITFQSVAIRFNMNPSYLCQIFQKEIKMTFTKYVTQLRIAHSKKLLRETNKPITEIGEESGFEQYYYFARVFKKETGESPTAYREKNFSNTF